MVTGTLTGIPFGGTTMVVLLTETDRLIGGGEKAAMPPPQPIKARKSPEQATPILERWGWCIRNSVRPHLVGSYPGLLNFSWLQCLLGYLIWCTRPLLQCDLAAQTLELGKGFFLL